MAGLHPTLLQAIVDVFNKLLGTGLPPWIMLAKVLLVPKTTEAVTIPTMRPITVFSLLFRLWAKVVARRLLLNWKMVLPMSVVGAVPGRSCAQLSLAASIRVERKLTLGCEAGGFSLDIEKCFNTFGRLPVTCLMKYHGMGLQHADTWLHSIRAMTRTASLLDSFSEPHGSSTGLAEGDPLAVCVMVLVGYTWHSLVSVVEDIWTSIFADDWQWHAESAESHIRALRITIAFLEAMKLTLDPHKSWSWGTTAKARKLWSTINLEVVGSPRHFAVTTTEKVLGVCLHFAKLTNHGCLSKRLTEGMARLERIAKLDTSMDKRAGLIQSTVWPMALFGTEVVYVGKKHISRLRSLAAAALLKKTSTTSNFMALGALTSRVMDPMVYIATRALCLWRRLLCLDKQNRSLYIQTLVAADSNPCTAYGPASALKCYMNFFGWKVSHDGLIMDHLERTFELTSVTPAYVVSNLRDAWDRVVTQHLQERVGFVQWPEVDLLLTQRIPLPDDARESAVIAKLRTVGSLYATQRENWAGHEQWTNCRCPLCESDDTREHFPFNCQGVQDLKSEFARTLANITQEYPHSCFIPVVHKHPKQAILSYLHQRREMPPAFKLSELGFQGDHVPTFYTDGSAAFPHLGGQIAAWAIVLDRCNTDAQREHVVAQLEDWNSHPSTLVPVQISLVSGTQTINRAELQALLQIAISTDAADIHSDSSWAIGCFEEIQLFPEHDRYWNRNHSDLLLSLCDLALQKDLQKFRCFKIKSHQNIQTLDGNLAVYHAMGNRFADELANNATKRENSHLHAFCWEVAEWYDSQVSLIKAIQPFLARSEIRRLDAAQQHTPDPDFAVKEHFSLEHAILWDPSPLRPGFTLEPSSQLLAAFQPSPGALLQLIRWCQLLCWPVEDTTSGGISFYELTVNFILVTHCRIPVMTERKKQHPVFRDFEIHDDAILFTQTVWDCVRFVENGLHYIRRFTGIEMLLLQNIQKRWFLSAFGYQKRISGIPLRPRLPHQLDHFKYMKLLVGPEELALPSSFEFDSLCPRVVLEEDRLTYRQRYLNHRALMNFVKRHGVIS
eukprot:Skav224171  [mRNA]  locus=scaffold2007:382978:386172:+ [translate_table: standard]